MVYRTMNRGGQTRRRRGGFRWQLMLLFAIGAAVYYFANQKTVPYTGRKQLRTMKPAAEMQLGLQSYQQILQDNAQTFRKQASSSYSIVVGFARTGFPWQSGLRRADPLSRLLRGRQGIADMIEADVLEQTSNPPRPAV